MKENSVIAIDGPAASGKSTVSRCVAAALGALYVDSGALYRAIAWKTLEVGADPQDGERVAALAGAVDMRFFVDGPAVGFSLDGRQLAAELRTERVNQAVSAVAANPAVRQQVTGWLRDMRSLGRLVMEGRDIGTAVFPTATFKFYLDASPEVRAQRRHAEMTEVLSVDAVGASLNRRDQIDSKRKAAPLTMAADAVVVDSSGMGVDEVVAFVLARVKC
ncbi:MAG TPA: (d)CMP kinase [Verrucomicrobia bacterium]|nr:(d)CMP kinase [Verrucomicrobiota bacterium]